MNTQDEKLLTASNASSLIHSAKETAVCFALISLLITSVYKEQSLIPLTLFMTIWVLWRAFRAGWFAFSRLERLHKVIEQEKWEIDHHPVQEREELKALYSAKGFSGKLLEDVLDVLMADQDRLLKVMVEEELGLVLESEDHPLWQALLAFIGGAIALMISLLSAQIFGDPLALAITSLLLLGISTLLLAKKEKRRVIPAIVLNLSAFCLSFTAIYILLEALF